MQELEGVNKMKNNLDKILFNHEMKKDFNIFKYNEIRRTSTTYENYIYEAIEGFEIDEIIKPKIEAIKKEIANGKGDKKKMQELYWGVEKLISLLNELNSHLFKDEIKKL